MPRYGVVKVFFQPERQHQRRAGADDGGLADRPEVPAAGNHAALRAELQRVERAGHPAGAVEQVALAGAALRRRSEFHPAAARDVAGSAIPSPYGGKFRQVQVDIDQDKLQAYGLSAEDVVNAIGRQNIVTPVGTREGRRLRIRRFAQRFADPARRTQRPADPRRQRRDGLRSRRRLCAFRRSAANQHGAGRRLQRRPDDDPEDGLGLDARRHQRRQGAASQAAGDAAREPEARQRSTTSRRSSIRPSIRSSSRASSRRR